MGKRWISLVLAIGMMFGLAACGKNTETNSDGNQRSDTENVQKYQDLLGQKEEKVVKSLGEGGEQGGGNTAANNAVRQYTDEVYGSQANCAVLFNEDHVTMVYITYEPGEMHFKTLLRKVTADYGEPDSKAEAEKEPISGDDSATAQWELENGSIFIYETVDGCGMQIAQ